MVRQINRLRKENHTLKTENRRLKAAIANLKQDRHDIELDSEVQKDVESVFHECHKSSILQSALKKQDDVNDTLQSFWQESPT